ncbi:MAG: hypothetical protein JNJ55_03320, partial [Betaproteobacteria bacterium]|nr:hypothetical protein [Betaproteobacteria bacterium]
MSKAIVWVVVGVAAVAGGAWVALRPPNETAVLAASKGQAVQPAPAVS